MSPTAAPLAATPAAPRSPLVARTRALVARSLARLPDAWQVRLSGEPPVTLDGLTLDPHLQLLRALRRRSGAPRLTAPDLLTARRRFRAEMLALSPERPAVGRVVDRVIPGEATALGARHYAPPGHETGPPRPLLVYLHGGGFVIGDLDTHDVPCRLLCRDAGVHVLSVDYRLAPEHPFPAAVEDAVAALRWARAHAAALGADPARVAVGGDSAGGNLAAVAAQRETRRGHPPHAQLLIYPVTDAPSARPSEQLFGDGFFLDAADRTAFTDAYLGGASVNGRDTWVAPLRAPDLTGLPPALVVTAGFDLLRDEGEAYAAAMAEAGTRVVPVREPALGHGFIHLTAVVPAARRAMTAMARAWADLVADR